VVSIVGRSGAGKSTLLHIMGILDRADSGSLLINNEEIAQLGARKLAHFRNQNIGFVFQFHHLLPEFTALENVCIPAYIGGKDDSEVKKRGEELLDYLGLSERLEHKPGQLSGGEQQRVSIARALLNDPEIILADEPTGNLDPETSLEIMKLLVSISQNNKAVLVATHDYELIRKFPGRILQFENETITEPEPTIPKSL